MDDIPVTQEERPDILRPSKRRGELDPLMKALQTSIRQRLDDVLFDDWSAIEDEEMEPESPNQ